MLRAQGMLPSRPGSAPPSLSERRRSMGLPTSPLLERANVGQSTCRVPRLSRPPTFVTLHIFLLVCAVEDFVRHFFI